MKDINELNKKYPPKEPLKTSDIILIALWIIFTIAATIITFNSNNLDTNTLMWLLNSSNMSALWGWSLEAKISLDNKDWLYEFKGDYSWIGDTYQYEFLAVNRWEKIEDVVEWDWYKYTTYKYASWDELTLTTNEISILNELFKYQYEVFLNLKFENWKLKDWSIYDVNTQQDIWKLTIEEINNRFNPEIKYQTKEIDFSGHLNASDLEENTIYSFTIWTWTHKSSLIVNDTEEFIIVYKKADDFHGPNKYNVEVILPKSGEGRNTIQMRSTTKVKCYYKKAKPEQVAHLIKTKYVSRMKVDEKIPIKDDEYIYNDTNVEIKATIASEGMSDDEITEEIIKQNEIIKLPSFQDYIIINVNDVEEEIISWDNVSQTWNNVEDIANYTWAIQ